ncbi:MAG: hypothetical protein Salg2KO_13040 [Salibacteraceae bacterium]
MTVSVVIPTYNSEHTIERAIRSCFEQTQKPLEIIVVDNNSTDQTVRRVKDLNGMPAVKVLTEPKQGANHCRNKGLAESSGDLIQFLDSDDELLPWKIEHQVSLFRKPEIAAVCGGYVRVTETDQKEICPATDISIPLLLFRGNLGKTSSMMFRRVSLLGIGGWSDVQESSQEYELLFRLFQYPYEVAVSDGIHTKVFEIGEQRISTKNRLQNALRFLDLRENMLLHFTEYSAREKHLWAQSLYDAIVDLASFDKKVASHAIKRHKNGLLRSLRTKSKVHAFIKFKVPILS